MRNPTELEAPVHEGQAVGRHPIILMTQSRWLLTDLCGRNSEKIDYGWCLRRCVTYLKENFKVIVEDVGSLSCYYWARNA